jgi:hypothetical protein
MFSFLLVTHLFIRGLFKETFSNLNYMTSDGG